MENPIKQIYNFNLKAGLLDSEYSDHLESSFLIEEALEGFDLSVLADFVKCNTDDPKDVSRTIVNLTTNELSDVERLDKACDAVVFAVGSMVKLGLNPAQITKALNIVNQANMAKLGCPRDEQGKLLKPDNFDELHAPESKLQKLLDERP